MSTATPITADTIRTYAADPMAYFADVQIQTAGGSSRLGDFWAPFQQEAFHALADCLLAVANRERPKYRGIWIERTKGGSKDTDVGIALLWLLMFTRWPQSVELAADDFDQILETSKAMQEVLRLNPWMAERVTVQKTKIVCGATASECLFLTRDETGSHGSRPTVTVCNELSHCGSEDFISTVMDNADKLANNLAIIATNAGHLDTWQWSWREQYRQDPLWWCQKVTEPGPWIDATKVAAAGKRNSPSRQARLWGGQWVAIGGEALEWSYIEAAKTLPGPILKRAPGEGCILGLDLGISHDHAALCVVLVDFIRRRVKLAWVEGWAPPLGGKIDLEQVYQAILWARQQYNASMMAYDPFQAEYMAQRASLQGIASHPVTFTGQALTTMASVYLEMFRAKMVDLYPDAALLDELGRLRIEETSYGFRLSASRDKRGHADRATAFVLTLPVIQEVLGQVLISDQQQPAAQPTWRNRGPVCQLGGGVTAVGVDDFIRGRR